MSNRCGGEGGVEMRVGGRRWDGRVLKRTYRKRKAEVRKGEEGCLAREGLTGPPGAHL